MENTDKSKVKTRGPLAGTEKEYDYERPVNSLYLDKFGREIPDPMPLAPPVGYRKQPTLAEQIRAMVRSERLRAEAEAEGYESFEEADDFDVGDDFDPTSPYEEYFDPPIPTAEASQEAPTAANENPATPVAPPSSPGPTGPAAGS